MVCVACVSAVCRVNAPTLLPLFREAKLLQERFDTFEIQHVYR